MYVDICYPKDKKRSEGGCGCGSAEKSVEFGA
jgi:hypothetical protein